MDVLAAAVMFSQSHHLHAGRGALTCDRRVRAACKLVPAMQPGLFW